jgi:hypothetical protein
MTLQEIYKKIQEILKQLLLLQKEVNKLKDKGETLFQFTKKNLGKSFVSDVDWDNDVDENDWMLGCARSVNNICKEALGEEIGGGASTPLMYQSLRDKKRFKEVPHKYHKRGDIIISPTGYSKVKGEIGHTGIMLENNVIASNNSYTGRLETKYNIASWCEKYKNFPIKFYRFI